MTRRSFLKLGALLTASVALLAVDNFNKEKIEPPVSSDSGSSIAVNELLEYQSNFLQFERFSDFPKYGEVQNYYIDMEFADMYIWRDGEYRKLYCEVGVDTDGNDGKYSTSYMKPAEAGMPILEDGKR